MYPNLNQELSKNRISTRMAAAELNMPESTFRYKLTEGDFSIIEAFSIKELLFPQYELKYLFAKEVH